MLVKPLQPLNAQQPMLVTPSGIVTLVRPLQPSKVLPPMLVTPSGIVTLVRPLQPLNASLPMSVTLFGIFTETMSGQSWNAPAGIRATPSGITSRSKRGPSSLTGIPSTYNVAPHERGLASASAGTTANQSRSVGASTRARFGQPANVPVPSAVTPAGSVTATRFVQSRNAPAGSPATDCVPDTRSVQTAVPAVWVRVCVPDVQGCQRNIPPPPENVAVSPSTVTVTVSPVREWASTARGVSPGTVSPSVQAAGTEMVGAVPVQSVARGSAPRPDRRPDSTRSSASVAFLVSSFIVVSFPFKDKWGVYRKPSIGIDRASRQRPIVA